jgi:hypothetical protein
MNANGIPIHNNKILLTSADGVAMYADSLPIPVGEPNNRDGWYFIKTAGAEKFNYYFYSQGSHAVTLADLEQTFFVGAIDNWVTTASCPFITVYTKPLGDGQDAAAWYRTKQIYTIRASANINLGEKTQFTTGSTPNLIFPYPQVKLNNIIIEGLNNPNEEILTMAVHSDSSSAVTTKILISQMGWKHQDHVHSTCIKLVA